MTETINIWENEPKLKILSEKNQEWNRVIVCMPWCWAKWVHKDMVSYLESKWFTVYLVDRNWDKLLSINENAIQEYITFTSNKINELIENWKEVHIRSNSFGSYLTFLVLKELSKKVSSVLAIAPLINPVNAIEKLANKWGNTKKWTIITLPDWNELFILKRNINFLKKNKIRTVTNSKNTLIILWNKDWLTETNEISPLENKCVKIVILGSNCENIYHWETTNHSETKKTMDEFYSKLEA